MSLSRAPDMTHCPLPHLQQESWVNHSHSKLVQHGHQRGRASLGTQNQVTVWTAIPKHGPFLLRISTCGRIIHSISRYSNLDDIQVNLCEWPHASILHDHYNFWMQFYYAQIPVVPYVRHNSLCHYVSKYNPFTHYPWDWDRKSILWATSKYQ